MGYTRKQAVDTTAATVNRNNKNPTLILEEAQNIALKHAGFSADQVMALHAEYEIEHGVPQYDVEFRRGYWEYIYEIHKRNRPHSCVSTFLRRILETKLS